MSALIPVRHVVLHQPARGKLPENIIDFTLKQVGYPPLRQYFIGKSIYGTDLFADFYLPKVAGYPHGLAIESKWQDTTGTTDEKLPYLVENIRHAYICPAIIVVGGEGFRPGSISYLKKKADGQRLLAVLRLEQFITWSQRQLPPAPKPTQLTFMF